MDRLPVGHVDVKHLLDSSDHPDNFKGQLTRHVQYVAHVARWNELALFLVACAISIKANSDEIYSANIAESNVVYSERVP